jgi:hypothetical protein
MNSSSGGNANVAIGATALQRHTNSDANTAIGFSTLINLSGDNANTNTKLNTSIGYSCDTELVSGTANITLGAISGCTDSSYNSASANTCIGYSCNTSGGSYNTYLGYLCNNFSGGSEIEPILTNFSTGIGTGAVPTADNQIMLGRPIDYVECPGDLNVAKNIVMSGASGTNYLQFPDGTQQFTSAKSILTSSNIWTGTNTFNNNNNLTVNGTSTFNNNITQSVGTTTLNSTTVNNNLTVNGTTTLNSTTVNNNLTVNGSIIPKQPGQLINTKFYTIPAVSGSSNVIMENITTVNTTTKTLTYYIDYTPINSISTIEIFINAAYLVSGNNEDSFQSWINLVNGTTIEEPSFAYGKQFWKNASGGGTRSGTLLPLTGIYQNSTNTVKRFGLFLNDTGSDDTLTLQLNDFNAIFIVKEYTI